mmetsp:Transcript_4749/g.9373  ORF Transcript_4749/g.9373 Transcript_4749/m.9373 type:complete len:240 (+) Transcript_4749:773-1492(+)
MLPSVPTVSLMSSRTATVSSSSPQISQALTTVLKTLSGGVSTLSCPAKATQSRKRAVARLDFSILAHRVTTLRQIFVLGRIPRLGICSRMRTASCQLSSSTAFSIDRLCTKVAALCAAEEEHATIRSPGSGWVSAFSAALRRRRPKRRLSIFSAAIRPAARSLRPESATAMVSSSYPAALAKVRIVMTLSVAPSFAATNAVLPSVMRDGVKDRSTTMARNRRVASSSEPSRDNASTTAS